MSFAFYRSLTIDHTQCGGSDSSSFPVLVFGSDASLKDVAHGGHVQSSTGADILFFADAGGVTQYPSEIEFYDNVNGILWAWVQVPSVSHSTNTTFYVLYGNSSPPARTTNPWDTNFKGVWHLPNGSSLTANDSTSNGNNGSVIGSVSAATGKIDGGAQNITAGVNGIRVNDSASLRIAQKLTMSAWINISSYNSNGGLIVQKRNATNSGSQFNYSMWVDGTTRQIFFQFNDGSFRSFDSNTVISLNTWHYLTTTVDETAGTKLRFYLDGSPDGTPAYAGTMPTTTDPLQLTNYDQLNTGTFQLDGVADEIRVSNIARGADWITTEYNNQNAPGNIGSPGFLTWGSEQLSLLVEDKITPGSITSRIDSGDIHFGGM